MAKRQWYEKYIGYCFNDNGRECVLTNIFSYEDGKRGYELYYNDNNQNCITDYKVFKAIAKQTNLPK